MRVCGDWGFDGVNADGSFGVVEARTSFEAGAGCCCY